MICIVEVLPESSKLSFKVLRMFPYGDGVHGCHFVPACEGRHPARQVKTYSFIHMREASFDVAGGHA